MNLAFVFSPNIGFRWSVLYNLFDGAPTYLRLLFHGSDRKSKGWAQSSLNLKTLSPAWNTPNSTIFHWWKPVTWPTPKSGGQGCICFLLDLTTGSQLWGNEELRTIIPSPAQKKNQLFSSSNWLAFQYQVYSDWLWGMWSNHAIGGKWEVRWAKNQALAYVFKIIILV